VNDKPACGPLEPDHALILDALSYPVLVISRGFRVVYMNAAARARYGEVDLDGEAAYCHSVLHGLPRPCHEDRAACPVCTVFDGGAPSRAVHEHRNAAGTFALEEIATSPLCSREGKVAYVVETVRDAAGLLVSKEVVDHMRAELDLLRGVLPTCAGCKRIRTEGGDWEAIESYVAKRSGAEFTHGLCPQCVDRLYPDYKEKGK
jgi:hypothetical protein